MKICGVFLDETLELLHNRMQRSVDTVWVFDVRNLLAQPVCEDVVVVGQPSSGAVVDPPVGMSVSTALRTDERPCVVVERRAQIQRLTGIASSQDCSNLCQSLRFSRPRTFTLTLELVFIDVGECRHA